MIQIILTTGFERVRKRELCSDLNRWFDDVLSLCVICFVNLMEVIGVGELVG
jgi:hypothetical protein